VRYFALLSQVKPKIFGLRNAFCDFEETAEGVCQLNLPWRPTLRFKDLRRTDKD
jgi:hypothetical protein